MTPKHSLDQPKKVALIAVDMQVAFVSTGQPLASPFASALIGPISIFAERLRDASGTVVWTRHSWSDEPSRRSPLWFTELLGAETVIRLKELVPGNAAHAIHPGLAVADDDLVIDKYRPSAFLPDHAGLHDQLQQRGIDTLIVCGTVTSFCCQATARDALMRDYRVCFPPDLNAGMTREGQCATLDDLAGMGLFDMRYSNELLRSITMG